MDEKEFCRVYRQNEWIVGDIFNKNFRRALGLKEDMMQEGRLCLVRAIRENEGRVISSEEIRVQVYVGMKNLLTKERLNSDMCMSLE